MCDIQLEPGNHFFELLVDDFQVNSAYASQFFTVTGITDPESNLPLVEISPNPFTEKYVVSCLEERDLRIYDPLGNMEDHLYGQMTEWIPLIKVPTGVYLGIAIINGQYFEQKMVYIVY